MNIQDGPKFVTPTFTVQASSLEMHCPFKLTIGKQHDSVSHSRIQKSKMKWINEWGNSNKLVDEVRIFFSCTFRPQSLRCSLLCIVYSILVSREAHPKPTTHSRHFQSACKGLYQYVFIFDHTRLTFKDTHRLSITCTKFSRCINLMPLTYRLFPA